MFDPAFFKTNRYRLRQKFEAGSLFAFTANGLLQRTGSTTYPFRQDSSFWYLTGLEQPDIMLVMSGEEEYLILPKRDDTFITFNGGLDKAVLAQASGISDVLDADIGFKKLEAAVLTAGQVVTCMPADGYIESAGFYTNPARHRLLKSLKKTQRGLKFSDARPELAKLRMVKRPEELEAIEAAVKITVQAFEGVKKNLQLYRTEEEIMSDIQCHFLKAGAGGAAYDVIVAGGANACTLHYLPKSAPLKDAALVLIDAGAEFSNYASDITRTYSLSKPRDRYRQVHSGVMNIRQYALSLLRPGISLKEYESKIRLFAAGVIKSLGLEESDLRRYYPHSTSHFMGLDVHDPADPDLPLTENMVITVEPGIYIAEEKIGIRIEDNIVITKNGYNNISENLSRELV